MRYDAILFDLFGTLVDNYSHQLLANVLAAMAEALGVPTEAFVHLWSGKTWPMRLLGRFATLEDTLLYICRQLQIEVTPAQLERACAIRLAYTTQSLQPRPDTISTLQRLKDTGYKLGLISDTSIDVASVWPATPMAPLFDCAIFSCIVKIHKPDPRIYQLACEQLSARPDHCLYVGDGGSNELAGASELGMTPVLILTETERTRTSNLRKDRIWTGLRVSTLHDVLPLTE